MDLIIIIAIGAIVAATGIISPKPKDSDISEEVKVVKTEEVQESEEAIENEETKKEDNDINDEKKEE